MATGGDYWVTGDTLSRRCARCRRTAAFRFEMWSCSATSVVERSSMSRSRTTSRYVGGNSSMAASSRTRSSAS